MTLSGLDAIVPAALQTMAALAITMRIGWEIKQNVFAHERREVEQFRSGQLGVHSKGADLNVVTERLQTGDAAQFDRQCQRPICPKRALGDPEIERINRRPRASVPFRLQLRNRTIFFAFKMQAVMRNLVEMNFLATSPNFINGFSCSTHPPHSLARTRRYHRRAVRFLSRCASLNRYIPLSA